MNAKEAPEKIYIQPDAQDGWFMVNNLNNTLVKYTRTDAFIEKAWEWVDIHFHETEINGRWGESRYVVMSEPDSFKDDLLKDFKKFMEGE